MDVIQAVELPTSGSVTGSLDFFPALRRLEILGPEGIGPALTGADRIDAAALVPENAVTVGMHTETRLAVSVTDEESPVEARE
jgi:hypothetical protein